MIRRDRPAVSVIIPVHNGARYLGEALASVFAQTYPAHEVIVIDDGSTDGSRTVAAACGSAIRYEYQAQQGCGPARNTGVTLATGACFAFLDADDLWLPDKLERQAAALATDRGADLVFGHAQQFHSPDLAAPRAYCPPQAMPGYAASALLIRAAAFHRVGPFSAVWRVGEFADWYLRAMHRGLRAILLPEVVVRRRLHETNMGMRLRQEQGDYIRILKTALDRRRAHPGGDAPA